MKRVILAATFLFFASMTTFAQGGWTISHIPQVPGPRIDDIFMVDNQTGYAVTASGKILKSTDGGDNWFLLRTDNVYHRSVEFINTQKGFVGSFSSVPSNNILMETTDGGASWTDLTQLIDPHARQGICGLAIPDSNTIYGCGNYHQDTAYIVKSTDGGTSWSFIDMHLYATHLIDMYFLNKDTGFATGSGIPPLRTAVVLYTTDGGQTWTYKFQNTVATEWCWKIQHLTDQLYFASIEEGSGDTTSRIIKSTDGGMNWNVLIVPYHYSGNGIQGVGFIDSLRGWTGGGYNSGMETFDGGITWDSTAICPLMNRVFRVNDSLLFASGSEIWKYSTTSTGIAQTAKEVSPGISLTCYPNPANKNLTVDVTLARPTHVLLNLLDASGQRVRLIETGDRSKGSFQYQLNTDNLIPGIYYLLLKTHDDQQTMKVIVKH